MGIINGVYASAEIFSEQVEEYAVAQIQMICDNKASEGSVISVMPDVHQGKVGTIGLTMTVENAYYQTLWELILDAESH